MNPFFVMPQRIQNFLKKIVTLAIQSPELPLWKKLTQHPQYPLLKEGVSLSLALKASFHFGEPSDLSTLFFPSPPPSQVKRKRYAIKPFRK
jgi:hypothetical protein